MSIDIEYADEGDHHPREVVESWRDFEDWFEAMQEEMATARPRSPPLLVQLKPMAKFVYCAAAWSGGKLLRVSGWYWKKWAARRSSWIDHMAYVDGSSMNVWAMQDKIFVCRKICQGREPSRRRWPSFSKPRSPKRTT